MELSNSMPKNIIERMSLRKIIVIFKNEKNSLLFTKITEGSIHQQFFRTW